MRKTGYLIILALLILACDKEKIVIKEIEKEYNWKAHDDFQYNFVTQMNSFATKDRLFILGTNSFSSIVLDSIDHPDMLFGGNVAHYNVWEGLPGDIKLPVCADYYVMFHFSGFVSFIPTMNPVMSGSSAYISISESDTTFTDFEFPHYSVGECIAINENNQTLIPYFINNTNVDLKVMLVDISSSKPYDDEYIYLDTIKTKIISVPDEISFALIALQSIGENFYLTTSNDVFRVDPLGDIIKVLDTRLYDIVEKSDTLYGFGHENIFISIDEGMTWFEGYEIQYEYVLLNYEKIEDRIIGYRYAQIFEIFPGINGISGIELDNDGLEGKTITSISKFQDKVYVTSLSGVYYKLSSDFFKEKETINNE